VDNVLIINSAGHKTYCEVRKVPCIENSNYVRIYTTFDGSRDPEYKQTKLELFLTDEQLETLKKSLA
jgi:hypothetical protein